MKFRAIGSGLTLAALAACSGGTGASVAPSPKSPTAISSPSGIGSPIATTAMVRVKSVIHIPRSKANTTAKKKRAYVSPGTEGLIIQVNQNGNESSVTGYDLTTNSSSSTCTVDQTGNDCTIYLNAPATNANSSDEFFIYAYDDPQNTSFTSNSQPSGHLLSEDIGSASNGDPVPSPNNPGISATSNNTLTFTLSPVVNVPQSAITVTGNGATQTFQAGPYGSTSLVLSVPGTGGTSNALTINGYDADGYQIQQFVSPTGTDTNYIDPISVAILGYGTNGFTFEGSNASTILGSTTQNTVEAVYAPGSNDAPTALNDTVPSGLIDFVSSFEGGYGFTTTYPDITPSSVRVAPLYSYVPSPAVTYQYGTDAKSRKASTSASSHRAHRDESDEATGLLNNIYALQSVPPTLPRQSGSPYQSYSLTKATPNSGNNDCTEYNIQGPMNDTNANDGPSIQAYWTVTITGSFTNPNSTCTLTMSDGISSIPVVLTQSDVTNTPSTSTTNTQITTPQSQAQPNLVQTSAISASAPLTYPAAGTTATIGDTLVCLEGFSSAGSSIIPNRGNDGSFYNYKASYQYGDTTQGIFLAAYDVVQSSDTLTSLNNTDLSPYDNGSTSPVVCGEFANTSAKAIIDNIAASSNSNGQLEPSGSQPTQNGLPNTSTQIHAPGIQPSTAGDGVIVAFASMQSGQTFNGSGYTQNACEMTAISLCMESQTQVDPNTSQLQPPFTTYEPQAVFAGMTILVPLGPSAQAQFDMVKTRAAVTHAR